MWIMWHSFYWVCHQAYSQNTRPAHRLSQQQQPFILGQDHAFQPSKINTLPTSSGATIGHALFDCKVWSKSASRRQASPRLFQLGVGQMSRHSATVKDYRIFAVIMGLGHMLQDPHQLDQPILPRQKH
ncbi:uncharacterized protein UDID_18995 [Ustilago sp. UG-2017a]|nr:uncharacterized protein UDID_18995 [Ustilago sp. UG-2017a]